MYERNAIVLERYFYEIFDFKNSSNLKENYNNYRKLFECYGNLCDAKQKEKVCQEEFNNISQEIAEIQTKQEELYNKGTKFEYSRYVIFNNIKEIPETIKKHLEKVNENVITNTNELKELSDKFLQAVIDYNQKENNYKDSIIARENAQNEYDTTYLNAKECYSNITEEKIKEVEDFINSDNKDSKKELQSIFEENGKNEKNQFDADVILNTINKSMEIYKNEMDVYLAGFDRIGKLFEEIETDSLKIDKHTKYYRDSKAKVDFLNSEKDYIIQFLDNERIGAIYDKKTHRKLMLEACKKFNLDFTQINNLYDIILKEIAGRSTKKIYKENYNKEYFIDLENSSIEPSLDTGKMRQEAIAFVNLNYWRIEGIRSIYNTFENVVTEIYGKDLTEFLPEELKQPEVEEESVIEEQVIDKIEENIEAIDKNVISQEIDACVDNDVTVEANEIEEQEAKIQNIEVSEIEEQEAKIQNIEVPEVEEQEVEIQNIEVPEIEEQEVEIQNIEVPEIEEQEAKIQNIEVPEIEEQEVEIQNIEVPEIEEQEVEVLEVGEQKSHKKIYYSSKISLAKAIYISLQNREFAIIEDEVKENENQYLDDDITEQILSSIDDIDNFDNGEIASNKDKLLECQIDNKLEEEEFEVQIDDELEEEEFEVQIDDELEEENFEVQIDDELEEEEFEIQIDDELEEEEVEVQIDDELEEEEFEVQIDDELEEEDFEMQINTESEIKIEDNNDLEGTFDLSKLDELEDDENLILQNSEESNDELNEVDIAELENELDDFQEENDFVDNIKIQFLEDEIEENEGSLYNNIEDEDFELCLDEKIEDDESILEIYYSEDKENNNSIENVKKKSGFFKKLVGFNAKEKKKA